MVLLAAALAPLLSSTATFAASVPSSAEARALGLDPLLRGGAALAFLHPQQAALLPRQLLVLDTGYDANGMGGILVAAEQRLFLFSTRETAPSGPVSGALAGWAGQVGLIRLGLSAGGYLAKESSTSEQLHWDGYGTDYQYYYNALDANSRSIQGLAGLGVGRGRSYLDLTWESRWETADRATAVLRQDTAEAETTVVSLEGDRRPFHQYHLRAGLPLGSAANLLLIGQWGGRQEHWRGSFRGVVFGDDLFRRDALVGWRDLWKAGTSVSFPLGEVDRITASAIWVSQKLPEYVVGTGMINYHATARRDGVLAVSVEDRVWRDFTLLAGLRRTYSRAKFDAESVDVPNLASASSSLNEGMGHAFTWGVAWNHGGYHVGAMASNTLRLDDLLASLDLGYRF
jgi:hypothetical protein